MKSRRTAIESTIDYYDEIMDSDVDIYQILHDCLAGSENEQKVTDIAALINKAEKTPTHNNDNILLRLNIADMLIAIVTDCAFESAEIVFNKNGPE